MTNLSSRIIQLLAAIILLVMIPAVNADVKYKDKKELPPHQKISVVPNEIILFEQPNYVKKCNSIFLGSGMRHALHPKLYQCNDEISSFLVGSNVEVYVFQHEDFRGGSLAFKKSSSKLEYWNDRISSLIVYPKGQPLAAVSLRGNTKIHLGVKKERTSQTFPLPESTSENEARFPYIGDYMNDKADDLYIRHPKLEVFVWQHKNFTGDHRPFPGTPGPVNSKPWWDCPEDVCFDLSQYNFADKISSLIVRSTETPMKKGVAKITPPPPLPPARDGSGGTTHKAQPTIPPMTGKVIQPDTTGLEMNSNRPGQDYKNFDLSTPDPKACQEACVNDPSCKAWTYVKPGVQGPNARCWLKSGVMPAEYATCCVSGVVAAGSQPAASPSSGKGSSSTPSGPVPYSSTKTVPMAAETGKVIKPQQAGSANLNGLWESSSGPIYDIRQNGNNITWTVQGSDEKGKGIINGQNISANWSSSQGSGSWNGRITKTDNQGKAVRIDWNHGVFLAR